MKKYLYLVIIPLLASMPMILTSCGGDDDDEPDSLIIGKWKLTKSTLKVTMWDVEDEKWIEDESTEEGDGETFEFTADKLFITEPNNPGNNETLDYHFNQATNTLYVFEFAEYRVQKLTSKELVLVQKDEGPIYESTLTIEFARI